MDTAAQLLHHKGGAIHSVAPDVPVLDAIRMMAQHSVGALLVMEGKRLLGVVSERDYARKVILLGHSSIATPVRQIMSSPVLTVRPDQTALECMQLMTQKRVRHLPVVDGDEVLGVLSIGDLVRSTLADQQHTIEELERYIHS